MAKISNQSAYPSISPADSDFIIGTDASDDNATKTFDFSGIFSYINDKLTDPSITPVYASEKVVQEVRFAEAVSKGDPVYISGYNAGQNRPEVSKADASDSAQMPSFGLATADYDINTNGYIINSGDLIDLDTDALGSEGDTLYVAAGGGLTITKPTGSNLIQNVGIISRSNSTNGSIEVSTIGRSNDVPNLSTGKIWVGSAANTIESTVVHLDETNDRLGINQTLPTADLHVGGDTVIGTTLDVGGVVTLNNSDVKQTTSQLDLIVGSLEDSMLELNASSGSWSWRIGELTSVTTIEGSSDSGQIDIDCVGATMARFDGSTPTNSFIQLGGTGAANKLDDYEEGTFTPTISSYIGGTLTPVYTTQNGNYTKIGNVCVAHVYLVLNSTSTFSGTGNLIFGGLPFPIDGNLGDRSVQGTISDLSRITDTEKFIGFRRSESNTSVYANVQASPSGYDQAITLSTANLETGGDIIIGFTLTYRTT